MRRMFDQSFTKVVVCIFLLVGNLPVISANDIFKEDSLTSKLKNTSNLQQQYSILMQLIGHTQKYDLKKSILLATQGEQLATNKRDHNWLAQFQLRKGSTHYYLSNYDEALEYYFCAIRIFKDLGDHVNLVHCYNNTGMIYDRIEDYPKAIDYYQLAQHHYSLFDEVQKKDNVRFLPHLYNNIASANNKLGKSKKALSYYDKALEVARANNSRHILGSIYNNLGMIETSNGNYPTAWNYLNKAITIRQEDGETMGMAKSYYFLSYYYLNTNKLDSAQWAANQCLEISEATNLLELQKGSHRSLFDIYEKKGMYKEALDEHKNFKLLSDSINSVKKVNRLSQLKISHEIEKIEEANLNEKKRIKYYYTLLIIILISILLITALIALLYNFQKIKIRLANTKLELEVETKNRELTTNVMQLIQKNQLLSDVTKDLLTLKKDLIDKYKKPLEKIISNLQFQTDNEAWHEFELRFNQVHTNFYVQIKKKHPLLTPSEKRLCALLRLNMTSKEVAAITNQTVRGVEVARSRLRKRLGLTGKDINLISYLESI